MCRSGSPFGEDIYMRHTKKFVLSKVKLKLFLNAVNIM